MNFYNKIMNVLVAKRNALIIYFLLTFIVSCPFKNSKEYISITFRVTDIGVKN